MAEKLIEIYVAANSGDAHVLAEQLRGHGVEVQILREQAAFTGLWFDSPRILVPREHEDFCRVIVAKFERQRKTVHPAVEEEQTIDAWPVCPDCKTRRLTMCPLCETAGNRFEEAFSPSDSSLRMCSTCEEAFMPEYYRRCHQCGHDFGAGREPLREEPGADIEATVRSWWVFVGLIVVVTAMFVYFTKLFT